MLDAVRYHSVGLAGWDMVGRVLYCADYLEPGRTLAREWRADLAARFPRDGAGASARWPTDTGGASGDLGPAATRTDGALLEQSRRRIVRVGLSRSRPSALGASVRLLVPPPPPAPRAHAYPIPSPGKRISVEVLNGTKRPGVARAATRMLRRQGLDVVFFGTGPAVDSTQVVVRRGDPGREVRRRRSAWAEWWWSRTPSGGWTSA